MTNTSPFLSTQNRFTRQTMKHSLSIFGEMSIIGVRPNKLSEKMQNFGALLIVEATHLKIFGASQNLVEFIGIEADFALGKTVEDIVSKEILLFIQKEAKRSFWDGRSPAMMPSQINLARPCWLRLNRADDYIILEFEDANGHTPDALEMGLGETALIFKRAENHDALFYNATERFQSLTGFDRVMMMRFASDQNIEVIAESLSEDWDYEQHPSLKKTWFPNQDIPQGVRLAAMNAPARVVADIYETSVPMKYRRGQGTDKYKNALNIDLGRCALRDVSENHKDFLRHFGISASMTFALVRHGQLWGLLIFQHRKALRLPPPMRVSVQLLLDLMLARLDILDDRETWAKRAEHRIVLGALLKQLREERNFARGLTQGAATLADLFSAQGAAIAFDNEIASVGCAPENHDIQALAQWIRNKATGKLYVTDQIGTEFEGFQKNRCHVSGVLAVFLDSDRSRILFWFRPEKKVEKQWAKSGHKDFDKERQKRIYGVEQSPSPHVCGHSESWQEWELEEARDLVLAINDIFLKFQAEILADANQKIRQQLSEREALAQALSKAKRDMELILGAVGEGIFSLDLRGQVQSFNQAALNLCQMSSQNVLGLPFEAVMTFLDEQGEVIAKTDHPIWLTLQDGQRRDVYQQELRLKNGRSFSVEYTVTPVLEHDHSLGAVIAFRDTTKQRAAEKDLQKKRTELERSNAELEQFAYVTSHDLREPLRMVDGYLRLIERRMSHSLDEELAEFLHFARDGAATHGPPNS